MATTPVWTLNQTIVGFNTTLTPGGTTSGNIDLSAGGFFAAEVQISVVFGATPAGRVVIDVYGSADGGTTLDAIPFKIFYIEPVPSTTRILSFTVSNRSLARIVAVNRDTVSSAAISLLYSGMQIS